MKIQETYFSLLEKTLQSKSKHFGIQSTAMIMKTLEDVIVQPQKNPEMTLEIALKNKLHFCNQYWI